MGADIGRMGCDGMGMVCLEANGGGRRGQAWECSDGMGLVDFWLRPRGVRDSLVLRFVQWSKGAG